MIPKTFIFGQLNNFRSEQVSRIAAFFGLRSFSVDKKFVLGLY